MNQDLSAKVKRLCGINAVCYYTSLNVIQAHLDRNSQEVYVKDGIAVNVQYKCNILDCCH